MSTVHLNKATGKSVLITRPTAQSLAQTMRAASNDGTIILDTADILRIGVSFFDEALLVFLRIIEETGNQHVRLVYHEAPRMQSLKRLVGNRGLTLLETPDGDWIIEQPTETR